MSVFKGLSDLSSESLVLFVCRLVCVVLNKTAHEGVCHQSVFHGHDEEMILPAQLDTMILAKAWDQSPGLVFKIYSLSRPKMRVWVHLFTLLGIPVHCSVGAPVHCARCTCSLS